MQQQSFAQRLQYLIDQSSLPINRLAYELKVSRQSIYNWINTNTIGKSSLQNLADHFEVSPNWLRDGDTTEHVSQVIEQRYMKAVNNHLNTMDMLIGTYFFNEDKIHWLGHKDLLLADNDSLPEIPQQVFKLLRKTEQKQLKHQLIKMLKAQKTISQQCIFHLAEQKCLCTLIPLKGDEFYVDGMTFNIQLYAN